MISKSSFDLFRDGLNIKNKKKSLTEYMFEVKGRLYMYAEGTSKVSIR